MTAASTTRDRRVVIAMVILNSFTTPLTLSAANVALPTIAGYFSLSAAMLSWVPMAYLMAGAMFILIFGRLADQFGRMRLFLIGTVAMALSSAFTGMAVSSAMLIGGRFLQGVSAAMLYATHLAIVASAFPPNQRGRAIGIVISTVYVGLMAGPVLGGIVTDQFGWRANFFLHIPLSLVVLAVGLSRLFLADGAGRADWKGERMPFDFPGAALFCLAIMFLCLGASLLPSMASAALLLLFAASIVAYIRYANSVPSPIWDVRLFFSNAIFTRSCGASLIMYIATYSNIVLMSLYLQELKALSASEAGLMLMIQPAAMALLSPIAGRLSDWGEPRVIATAGMALSAVGLLMLSNLDAGSDLSIAAVALVLNGTGFGLFTSPNSNAILSSVQAKDYGAASATISTTRVLGQLGSMVLVALAMSLLIGERLIDADTLPQLERAIQLTFGLAAAICVPGIVLSMLRGRMHRADAQAEPEQT
ncbi:MAG: MFS transporter [Gammaproteobacteria bacterium]|nr:MFS transporter [Gammaproteobacteria bacterium]